MNTITNIAKVLKVKRHVVSFLIRDRGIEPIGKIGATHIYSDESIEKIRKIINQRKGS